jgi:Protein of unknown function (DUF1353)
MFNPPDPQLESIDGDTYQISAAFQAKFSYWLRDLQFEIPAGTITDLASIPWFIRWINDRASLGILAPVIHDYLCDRRGKVINLNGDAIQLTWFDVHLYFLVAMRIDGISWHRSLLAFIGVVVGGPRW